MSKRPAQENLEALVLSGMDSPRSKRVKVEDEITDANGYPEASNATPEFKKLELSPKQEEDVDNAAEEEGFVVDAKPLKEDPPPEYSDLYLDTGEQHPIQLDD